jgi:hypothetical protein
MKRYLLIATLLFTCCFATQAQDLNARVKILSTQNTGKQQARPSNVETAMKDFLNGRKWAPMLLPQTNALTATLY